MAEKVYEPEVIVENPFPGEPLSIIPQTPLPKGTYGPTTTPAKPFPTKRVATELLSTALNTRSRKVLGEFELADSGGFKVGDYKSGVSGDLRITPNGLTARDKAGLTTFAIDGDTGDAVFKGTIRSGSQILEGEMVDENGVTIIDAEGIVSTANFTHGTDYRSTNFSTSSTTPVDITGSSITFELARESVVMFFASGHIFTSGGATGVELRINVDATNYYPAVYEPVDAVGGSTHLVLTLASGSHTAKLTLTAADASTTASITSRRLTYLVLGK